MTGKQRSALRALANKLEPVVLIGKSGVTDAVLKQAEDALNAHELIKLGALKNSGFDVHTEINALAVRLRAEPVQAIGDKMVLYRRSYRKDVKHIEF